MMAVRAVTRESYFIPDGLPSLRRRPTSTKAARFGLYFGTGNALIHRQEAPHGTSGPVARDGLTGHAAVLFLRIARCDTRRAHGRPGCALQREPAGAFRV